MSLSKVYRGAETADLQEFQFRSFGDVDSLTPPVKGAASAPSVVPPVPSAGPGEPSVDTRQQIQDAYARGREEGLALAEQRFASTTQALAEALEEVSRLRDSLAKTGSQDMLRLVIAVSEQIIHQAVAVDRNLVLKIIERALQASVRADSFRIRISPEDLELVTKQKPLFLASVSGLKNLSFEADPEISPGGCRVDSELGNVDATIETQLDVIRQALCEAITAG